MAEEKPKKREFRLDTVPQQQLDDSKRQQAKDALMKIKEGKAEESEPKEPEPKEPEEKAEEPKEDIDLGPVADGFSENMRKIQETLLSKENQEAVKEICKPLSVSDMLREGEFRQVVPIVKEEFEVEFRSISAQEDLALKKIVADMEIISERYFMDLYTLYQLTIGVVSINGAVLPKHLDKGGKLDKKLLTEKLEYILNMPLQATATLGVHYYWFDLRVRELFDIERTIGEVKNG